MHTTHAKLVLVAMPLPVFIVDEDVRLLDCNPAGAQLLGGEGASYRMRRGGEVLHCLQASVTPEGCGHAPRCKDCVIRSGVIDSFRGNCLKRRKTIVEVDHQGERRELRLLVTTTPIELDGVRRVLLIIEDVGRLAELRELVPICSRCKKIRDDQDYWQRVESYLHKEFDLDFTHGLCPECTAILFPGVRLSSRGKPSADEVTGST